MEVLLGAFTSEWEQRRAALLHDLTLGGRRGSVEDELKKRLKAVQPAGGGASRGGGAGGGSSSGRSSVLSGGRSGGGVGRSMEARLGNVAKGSQPAVVKMASYGGGARVGAMLNYVSRAGELSVETENGEKLHGAEDLARVRGDWSHLFQNRAESRDIGSFSVEVGSIGEGVDPGEYVRDILTSGFGDRRYVYTVDRRPDGALQVDGYVVLRSGQGERLTADAKAADIVQERYDASAMAGETSASFSFHGSGNGVDYGTAKIRNLIEERGSVWDDQGHWISSDKKAGDLVQKEWRKELHSRKSRDVMHVILSARAGTDAKAFEGAVRDFLAEQYAGHRYVFAMHDPASDPKEAAEGGRRPHVHAHAIVTMRSDAGERIETTPATFRQWREVMAQKARDHGIAMEMTDRREFAAPPAYTQNQVRPVVQDGNRDSQTDGRTEHEGTSEAAQVRYDAKRSGRRMMATSRRSRQYAVQAQETWEKIAVNASDAKVAAFASAHHSYLECGLSLAGEHSSGSVIHAELGGGHRANMKAVGDIASEEWSMREQTRPEFEAYEKRVEKALFKLQHEAGPEDRKDVEEVSELAREVVGYRRQMLELNERERAEQAGTQNGFGKSPVSPDTLERNQRDLGAEPYGDQSRERAEWEPNDRAGAGEATRKDQDPVPKDKQDAQGSEDAQTDPLRPKLTRLQELEFEQKAKRERDRDDWER